ncbi:MAG TPA: methyltransferase domain-containing protein [Candidatus Woesearchaeota archaeon]|nr:methyltransferase domain-containing protein [Candidatus Woesearchaeota archaeon]
MDLTQKGKKQTSNKKKSKDKKILSIRGPFAKISQKKSFKKSTLKGSKRYINNNKVNKDNNKNQYNKNQEPKLFSEVYFPREDSTLLKESSKSIVKGIVLEMGCGSGYVLCSLSPQIEFGIGLDINPLAIKASESYSRIESKGNLWFFQSNLFSFLENFSIDIFMNRMWLRKGKTKKIFDYIIFNPPYLPDESDLTLNDIALNGGKIGTEIIEKFLKSFKEYLKPNGKALIIVSSIILDKFLVLLSKHKINFLLINKKAVFYEELYCYKIW